MGLEAMGWRSLAAALVLVAYAGCASDEPPGGASGCTDDSGCGAGSVCRDGFCVATEDADAGSDPGDAGDSSDAGTGDDGGVAQPDTTPPAIDIDSPLAAAVLATEVEVSVKVSDEGSGVSKVEASLNGIAWNALTLAGDAYTGTLPLPVEDNVNRTLTVRAFDGKGNKGEAAVEFVNDGAAPVLTLTEPPLAVVNRTHLGGVLEFKGTASDGAGVVDTEYSLNKVDWQPVNNPTDFSVKYAIPDQLEETLVLYFRAVDRNGNVTEPLLETKPIRIDTIAPTWAFTSPDEGHVFTLADPATGTVAGSSTSTDIASADLLIDGTSRLEVQTGTLSYSLALAAEDDVAHQIEVRVADSAGNEITVNRSYRVDRVPPKVAITVPAQDYDCSGMQCINAAVSLAFPNLAIAGTASDGAGLAATGGMTIAIGGYANGDLSVTSNGNWSYTWNDLPTPNGEEVPVTATATDANGNTATAVRKLWVDRVPPKATKLVDNARRVVRTEPLVRFDEPMDVSSVRASKEFFRLGTGVPTLVTSLNSTDGMTFQLSTGSELALYTPYAFSIGPTAMDKSGNQLEAEVVQRFHTEGTLSGSATVATRGEKALLFVDTDGNPIVFHRNTTSVGRPSAARWNGVGAYVLSNLDNNAGPDTCDRGFSAAFASSVDATSLELHYAASVLYCVLNAGTATVYHARSSTALTFTNTQSEYQFLRNDPAVPPGSNPSMELARLLNGPIQLVTVPRARFLDASGNLKESLQNTSTYFWSDPPTQYLAGASGALLSESAFAHSGKLIYAPTKTEVATLAGGESFTAISGQGTSDFGGTTPGHLLWATQNGSAYTLRAACAQNPGQTANWKVAGSTGFSTTSRIERVEVRVMNGRVLYAVQTANDQVHYATHTDVGCAAAPASLSWTRIPGAARRPSIALDKHPRTGAEKVFVAYEEPSSGALKLYTP